MIIDDFVTVTIGSANQKYWLSLGYNLPNVGGRGGKNGHHQILVEVCDLPPKSNVLVNCKCDECHVIYTNRYDRTKDFNFCRSCDAKLRAIGNTLGSAHKGKKWPQIQGENHPRWNPNKKEFRAYANKIRWLTELTYRENVNEINPNNYPRTLCGVDGGYQLDHIVSVKTGFVENIDPEDIAALNNLQMLSWEENRAKAHH